MSILGVDVSHHQGTIDWGKAHSDGVVFGITKCSEGRTFTDPAFSRNITGMRAAGIIPGAYHFLRHGDPTAQANHFAAIVGANPKMILALDVEKPKEVTPSDVAGFINRLGAIYGATRPLLAYSNKGLYSGGTLPPHVTGWHAGSSNGRYSTRHNASLAVSLAGTPLNPSSFGGLKKLPMIQFTDHATVRGIIGPVDGNVWLAGIDQLRALAGIAPASPAPPYTLRRVLGAATPMMHGDDVRHVQRLVNAPADGWYGPVTTAHVKAWQHKHNLKADGVFGPASARAAGWRFG